MKSAFKPLNMKPSFCAHKKVLLSATDEFQPVILKKLITDQIPSEDTFEIRRVPSFEETSDAFESFKPDIFITNGHINNKDLKNPDGIKLAELAKKKGIKSIGLMSGIPTTVEKARKLGLETIQKPEDFLNLERLKEFIGKLLKKAKA